MLTAAVLTLTLALANASPAPRTLFRRDLLAPPTPVKPAEACSTAAPFECEESKTFCCAESTQCHPIYGGRDWVCKQSDLIENAFACGASDTACEDGVTCCPEDMACAPEGGCVSTDLDLGGDAAEDDPLAQVEECDDGETLCVNVCCTGEETCDAKTGMCMAGDAVPPPSADNSTISAPGNATAPGLSSGKDKNATTSAPHETAASPGGMAPNGTSSALNGTASALNATSAALNGTAKSPCSAANGTAREEARAAVNAAAAAQVWGVPIVAAGVSLSVVALSMLCMDK